MHETQLPPADQAVAARLRHYFDAESTRAEATATALLAPAGSRGRARPFAIRFAPLGGGFAVVAVLAVALAFLPFRGGGVTGGGGSNSPVADSTPSASAVVYASGVPVRIGGLPVYTTGAAITTRLGQPGSFLVAGTLAQQVYDCAVGRCPPNGATVLMVADSTHPQGFPLLTAGDIWRGDPARWQRDVVVLSVRAYDAVCPWADYCKSALLVEAAIPPR